MARTCVSPIMVAPSNAILLGRPTGCGWWTSSSIPLPMGGRSGSCRFTDEHSRECLGGMSVAGPSCVPGRAVPAITYGTLAALRLRCRVRTVRHTARKIQHVAIQLARLPWSSACAWLHTANCSASGGHRRVCEGGPPSGLLYASPSERYRPTPVDVAHS